MKNTITKIGETVYKWLRDILPQIKKDKWFLLITGFIFAYISLFHTFDIMRFCMVMDEYSKNYDMNIRKDIRDDISLVEFKDTVDKETIYRFVEKLIECNAAVIGIDIHFNEETKSPEDSILYRLIREYPNIVLAYGFDTSGKEYIPDYSYFIKKYDDASMGFSNLVDIGGIACAYKQFVKIDDVDYPSFSTKMAEIYSGKKVSSSLIEEFPIDYDYSFNEFFYPHIYDDDYDFFKNKIVIIGLNTDIPNSMRENAKGYFIQGCILASTLDNIDENYFGIAVFDLVISIIIVIIMTVLSKLNTFSDTLKSIFIISLSFIVFLYRNKIGLLYIYILMNCIITIIFYPMLYEIYHSRKKIVLIYNTVISWLKIHLRGIASILLIMIGTEIANAQYTPVVNVCMEKHNGMVNHLVYDKTRKYIATVSEDKSVKIWNANNHSLINTINMPEGEGGEGVLYTCVFHPVMNNIILVAGNTGARLQNLIDTNLEGYYFYVVDWEKGKIIDKIGTFRREIKFMEYSPDTNCLILASDYEDVYIYDGHKLVRSGYLKFRKEIINDIYFEGKKHLVITTEKYRRTYENFKLVKKEKNKKGVFNRTRDTDNYKLFQYREMPAPDFRFKDKCLFVEYKDEAVWEVSMYGVKKADNIYGMEKADSIIPAVDLAPITSEWIHYCYYNFKTGRWIDENGYWIPDGNGSDKKEHINFLNHYILKTKGSQIYYSIPYRSRPYERTKWINDSFFIISYYDGTLRWYDSSNGNEVLALFIDKSGNWIYWVPEGFFYSEPASNSFLIEWKMQSFMNVIVKKPDMVRHNFYSKSFIFKRLEDIYIGNSINPENHESIVNLENIMTDKFPILKIDSVIIDREWYIYYSLDNYKGEIYGIYSLIPEINDRNVNFNFIEQTDNGGIIVAETEDSIGHVCVYLESELNGPVTYDDYKLENAKAFKPKNVRLAGFGISKYSTPKFNKLESCINDVYDFSGVLEDYFYKKCNKRIDKVIMCNDEVTYENVCSTMDSLYNESENDDITVFYFSGHGILDEKDGKYYLVSYNADNNKTPKGIDAELLIEKINRMKGYKIVFIDACFSGYMTNKTYKDMSILASSRMNQKSFARNSLERSVFTDYIVRYFNSICESEDDLDLNSLAYFLRDMTENFSKGKQSPVFSISNDMNVIKL